MRRHLCLLGLAFVAAMMIGIPWTRRAASADVPFNEESVAAVGRVGWKEYRLTGGKEVLMVSLEQVIVLKPDQTASLTQIISDSDTIWPKYFLARFPVETGTSGIEIYCKENRERLQRADAGRITGLLCYWEEDEEPAMGSYVVIEGKFRAFTHATNPGEFDSANYYHIMGKQGRLTGSRCLAKSGGCDRFRENLYRLKEYLALLLKASYPPKEAEIMRAMLLGEKGTLDTDIKSLYQQNGIIHILAISGLHLSILGMGLYKVLRKLHVPNMVNIILSIAWMYCYGTMTGMGVSIIRALVMFGFHLAAGLFGRTYDMLTAMTVAALSILIQQPLYLTHSGFLFSFGAICGIGLFVPAVEAHRFTDNRLVRSFFTGMGISLSTLPVYCAFYSEFPPYSVLLNLLVIPCMSLILTNGIAVLAIASLILPLGKYLARPGVCLLWFYEKCCDLCLSLPGHQWITGSPAVWQITLFILLLAGLALFYERMKKWQFWTVVLLAVFVLTVRLPQGFEVTALDVGQGDCIYLTDGAGSHYLIDGGSSTQKEVETYQILPFLKYRGVRYLDAVFVTHPDSDHINGIQGMLETYGEHGIEIGCLVLPDVAEECRHEEYHMLESLAWEAGIPVQYIHAGQKIENGEVMLTCMHPGKNYASEDANVYSTVLYLRFGVFTALFTGDLEGEGERLVMEKLQESGIANVSMLKVAHHGSRNSTPVEFVKLVNPQIALISAGRNNSYGHPHPETLERFAAAGCRTYQTPISGAVTVRVKGGKVYVEEYLEE